MEQRATRRSGALREFFGGVRLLGGGLRLWATAPRLMLLGAVPALIVAAVYLAGIILLAINLEGIAVWATPFADAWDEPLRTVARFAAILAFLAIAVLLAVFTFVAVTLTVGDPFYERIWRHVEERLGNAPADHDPGFWRSAGRGIRDSLRLLISTALFGVLLFALGLIPLVGQILVPIAGAIVAGWFLAVELAGFAFTARGRTLRERRKALRRRRAMTLGFGVPVYLLFLVPFGAVIVMPAAVAGATLLSRRILDDPAPLSGGLTPPPTATPA